MSRTIFIGDVHGCIDELLQLVHELSLQIDDTLVFVGDLIHKGPDSEAVLNLVHWLTFRYDVYLICGNHEEKHLRWLRAEAKRKETGKKNRMMHVEEYPDLYTDAKTIKLMQNSYLALAFGSFTTVHAGIPGNLRELEFLSHDEWLATGGSRKKAQGQVMRVRYLNSEGHMLALGKQEPGDPYWTEVYDGRFGTVVFGHNPFLQSTPMLSEHAYGIDLGCVHGGFLCALIVEDGQVTHKTVKAKRIYKPRPRWAY
jgi:serine/threonine protein phosphatase 1